MAVEAFLLQFACTLQQYSDCVWLIISGQVIVHMEIVHVDMKHRNYETCTWGWVACIALQAMHLGDERQDAFERPALHDVAMVIDDSDVTMHFSFETRADVASCHCSFLIAYLCDRVELMAG